MRFKLNMLLPAAALVAAGLISIPSASASNISIGLQQAGVNGGAITTVATDFGTGSASYGGVFSTYGQFTLNQITATGSGSFSPSPQGNLTTAAIDLSSATTTAAVLTIYITEQGLISPSGLTSFLSGFTSNAFGGSAISVAESTYYSNSNQLYGGTQLDANTFTAIGSVPLTDTVNLTGTSSNPYSETVEYVVTKGAGTANVNDTIDLRTTAVTPEPSSLALLGTGLVGAASMALRRRKMTA